MRGGWEIKKGNPPKSCPHSGRSMKGRCRGNVERRRHLILFYCNAKKENWKLKIQRHAIEELLLLLLLLHRKDGREDEVKPHPLKERKKERKTCDFSFQT